MADVAEIDRLNIRQASLLAMVRAVANFRCCLPRPDLRPDTSRPDLRPDTSRSDFRPDTSRPDSSRSDLSQLGPFQPDLSQSDLFRPDFLLIDGRDVPPALPCAARAVVKGDTLSASIAAASILAKVTRDTLMDDLAHAYPGYGWERNKGYPTREHVAAIQSLGVALPHRRTFGPVRLVLATGRHPI
ncbi:MAG: hypothetical protein HQL65_03425 [Magnetococcales bacterium]|nr:hypothetical protein [Magnetococcales bacterium]